MVTGLEYPVRQEAVLLEGFASFPHFTSRYCVTTDIA